MRCDVAPSTVILVAERGSEGVPQGANRANTSQRFVRLCLKEEDEAPPGRLTLPKARAKMTAAVFFGCTFIAFGPAIALFLFTIAREPLRVIFLIAG